MLSLQQSKSLVTDFVAFISSLATKNIYRGVNLYVFHVGLMDFHCFDWLTYVRGNPYGFIIIKK